MSHVWLVFGLAETWKATLSRWPPGIVLTNTLARTVFLVLFGRQVLYGRAFPAWFPLVCRGASRNPRPIGAIYRRSPAGVNLPHG